MGLWIPPPAAAGPFETGPSRDLNGVVHYRFTPPRLRDGASQATVSIRAPPGAVSGYGPISRYLEGGAPSLSSSLLRPFVRCQQHRCCRWERGVQEPTCPASPTPAASVHSLFEDLARFRESRCPRAQLYRGRMTNKSDPAQTELHRERA